MYACNCVNSVGYTHQGDGMVFQVSYEAQNGEENETTEELTYAQVARGREFYKIYYKDQTSQLKQKNAAENRSVRDSKAREKEATRKDCYYCYYYYY